MAKKPVQVTEAEWEKDKEGVQRIETPIPGFPDAEPFVTYVKVETLDDLTEKAAKDTETVPLLVPVEKEKEVVVIGEDGEPEKNDDGSDKLTTEKYWDFEPREIDLGAASLKKLVTALAPFAEKSRARSIPVPGRPAVAASSAPSSARAKWLAEVREWAVSVGHKVSDRGRIAQEIRDAYVKANPDKPEPTS